MTTSLPPAQPGSNPLLSPRAFAICLIIAALVMSICFALQIRPRGSRAATAVNEPPPVPPSMSESLADSSFLGSFVSRDLRVLVHTSAAGPVYTVYSTDGRVLGERLTMSALSRAFPALPIDGMQAGAAGDGRLLMHADNPAMDR